MLWKNMGKYWTFSVERYKNIHIPYKYNKYREKKSQTVASYFKWQRWIKDGQTVIRQMYTQIGIYMYWDAY